MYESLVDSAVVNKLKLIYKSNKNEHDLMNCVLLTANTINIGYKWLQFISEIIQPSIKMGLFTRNL